ncbi:MAG: Methyl-accepting chemotaxis protein 4 [Candidatus Accumulibacter phosphatis]|jgi:cytochrome c|uniref:Methyl-accepting chemotaxis protein 4 n=1 Tax=Candidatus Accumulibacter phosphatis TaxID=327160 RepID=A0A084Y6N5_9PROT|nr:cache domain-containing protein [Accumulibacter sp.]KFB70379.1 MAG: Methyl-accepting chemotaxis protein 4 [Candidatus Accumulibacter phosphatis]HRF12671.1 cache domain-containing protein [Candidatus Accumulibacter phosphatis]
MKKILGIAALGIALGTNAFAAGEFGTPKEAEAHVQKAIKHLAAVGKDKAFADFGTPAWVDRDIYLVVLDFNGHVVAHGTNPKLIGKDMMSAKDPDGVAFTALMVDSAKVKGKGWTDYKFTDPATKKVLSKASYCEKQGEYSVCAGIYKR